MTDGLHASVVVCSAQGGTALRDCLSSLLPQCRSHGIEIIVARRSERPTSETEKSVGYRVAESAKGATLPELRAAGIRSAMGEWVLVIEDHCRADAGWLEALLEAARRGGAVVIGGAIGMDPAEDLVARAAFIAEYGIYGGGGPNTGAPPPIAVANIAYHRSVIAAVLSSFEANEWENVTHDRLHTAGCLFTFVRSAVVRPRLRATFGQHLRDRFEHGRSYAVRRTTFTGPAFRSLLIAGAPLLPLLLTVRIFRAMRPGDRSPGLTALPVAALLLAGWAAGEVAGYLRGPSS